MKNKVLEPIRNRDIFDIKLNILPEYDPLFLSIMVYMDYPSNIVS